MSARIVCSPPLGQTTIVQGDVIQITVVLSLACSENDHLSQVVVWHNNSQSREWTDLDLNEVADNVQTLSGNSKHSKCFRGALPKHAQNNVIHFTLKYRSGFAGEWHWVNEQLAMGDAEVVFSNRDSIDSLSYYFREAPLSEKHPNVTSLDDASFVGAIQGTRVWSTTTSVKAAMGGEPSYAYTELGIPTKTLRWFCIARESVPWLCPRQGRGNFAPREDAILAHLLRTAIYSNVRTAIF